MDESLGRLWRRRGETSQLVPLQVGLHLLQLFQLRFQNLLFFFCLLQVTVKVIHVIIVGDKSWWWWWCWWSIEGPLVVNIVLLRQGGGGGTKEVLVVPVGSIDQIILEPWTTGQMETAGCHEGCSKVGLSVDLILKWQSWGWGWVIIITETPRADKAGEGKGVDRVGLLW